MPADDLDNFGAERLHPMVTTWRCRPMSDIHCPDLFATKPPLKKLCRYIAHSGLSDWQMQLDAAG